MHQPFLASQHAAPSAIRAAPVTRPTTSDGGDESPVPSKSSTVRDGVASSPIAVPTSTRAVTIKSDLVFTRRNRAGGPNRAARFVRS